MKKAPSDNPILQLKNHNNKPYKVRLIKPPLGPHYEPHCRTQGCLIRENNITDPITNSIKDPIKYTLVPLRTNFNANGSKRWRTSLY